jgi:hypothetical protein
MILFQLFTCLQVSAQNEFAATVFYKEFQRVYAEAQNGFESCKGAQRKTGFEELQLEYKTKCLLPLADSGKIIVPHHGNSYSIFYFEPDKLRLKIDQRALNLRDAVVTAIDLPLFARTETFLLNNHPFTKTLFFNDPEKENSADALFIMSIFFNEGKYFLSFEVKGKK